MLMADTMAIFFVVLGLLLAFPGLWLLCRGLWPQAVSTSTAVCRRGLIRPFLLGLPITVVVVFVAAILGNLGTAGKISAVSLVCIYLMFAHSGLAGLVTCIGERLDSNSDVAKSWRATMRGSIVLELAYLLPILGWFLILPVSFVIGCGANTISIFKTFFATVELSEQPHPANAEASGFRMTGNLEAGR